MTKHRSVRLKVGNVLEIPLSDGRRAFGQYVHRDKMGPLLQVFDLITVRDIQLDQLQNVRPLFPPIYTGIFAAVRVDYWRIIGYIDVEDFVHPKFISTFYDQKTGKAGIWFLWDGEKSTRIGHELPLEYKSFEYLIVWDPHDVVQRIETGNYPYPYTDLIQNNSFEPRPTTSM